MSINGHHHHHLGFDPTFFIQEETDPNQLGHSDYSSYGPVQFDATLDHLVVIFTKAIYPKLYRFHIPWHQVTGLAITLLSCKPLFTSVQHLQYSITFAHYGALPRRMRIRVDSKTRTMLESVYESKQFGSLLRDMIRLNLLPKLNGSGKSLMVWRLSQLDGSSHKATRVKGGRIVNGKFEGAGELTELDVSGDYEFEIKPRVKAEVASDYNSGEEDSAQAKEMTNGKQESEVEADDEYEDDEEEGDVNGNGDLIYFGSPC